MDPDSLKKSTYSIVAEREVPERSPAGSPEQGEG